MKIVNNSFNVLRRIGSLSIGETFLNSNGDLCSIFRNGNTSSDLYVNLTKNTVTDITTQDRNSLVEPVTHEINIST